MKLPLNIDHIGIAVHDLDAAINTYASLLQCEVGPPERLEARGISVAFVGQTTPHLELVASNHAGSELAPFLKKHGEGVHHICVCVEDLVETVERLERHGARLAPGGIRAGAKGALVAFVHPKDAHGVLLELVQKS